MPISVLEVLSAVTLRQAIAGLSLMLGSVLIVSGLLWQFLRDRGRLLDRPSSGPRVAPPTPDEPGRRLPAAGASLPSNPSVARERRIVAVSLALVTAAGALLRVFEIEEKTLTHTEAMLPNLAWPSFSWPPARFSFYDTFWWHYHSELHPPAHYLLMWAWTNVFGTSLTSLRLPSALFGVGAIVMAYAIGALIFGRYAGLLAAVFVAFNGFHIFNSQYARIYMMGAFLALASTYALLKVVQGTGRRRGWEISYLLLSWLAVYTQTFFWLVLAVQIAWSALQFGRPEVYIRRILGLQAVVVMTGATAIAHQIYQGAPTDYPPTTLAFVADYLLLGFAFLPDVLSIPPRILSAPIYWAFAALAVILFGLGCSLVPQITSASERATGPDDSAAGSYESGAGELWARGLVVIAVGSALVTLAFVIVALRRNATMSLAVAIPLFALALPPLHTHLRRWLAETRLPPRLRRIADLLGRPPSLVVLLALLPAAAIFVVSLEASVLNPRAFTMFSSFLLIVAGAGAWVVSGIRILRVPLLLALAVLHVGSVEHMRFYPSESRDYKALSAGMNERMRPGDLVFVIPEEHAFTPLYYYLDGRGYTYVPSDYAGAVEAAGADRVWLVYVESYGWGPFMTTNDEMRRALAGFRVEDEVVALRSRAELLERVR